MPDRRPVIGDASHLHAESGFQSPHVAMAVTTLEANMPVVVVPSTYGPGALD